MVLNHLIINTKKNEMVFDPKLIGNHSPVFIHEEPIKQVCSYKYLGVYMDNLLTWGPHVDGICSRVQQRLHFLRILRVYGVQQKVMYLFYKAVIGSVLHYGYTVWFGNITVQSKAKLAHLVKTAMGIIVKREYQTLESSYEQSVLKEVTKILSDPSHSLYPIYELLPSGRRYRLPVCRYISFKKSFVPTSIRLLNM